MFRPDQYLAKRVFGVQYDWILAVVREFKFWRSTANSEDSIARQSLGSARRSCLRLELVECSFLQLLNSEGKYAS